MDCMRSMTANSVTFVAHLTFRFRRTLVSSFSFQLSVCNARVIVLLRAFCASRPAPCPRQEHNTHR